MASLAKRKREEVQNWNVPVCLNRDRVGAVIRKLRKDAGLTLSELEAKSGVSNSEISKLESGSQDCRLFSFVRIAAALGLPAGPAIDLALFVDCRPYERAIRDNPAFGKLTRELKISTDIALFYASVLVAFAAQLVISSKPTLMAINIAYPNEKIRDAFASLAETIELGMTAQQRFALVTRLKNDPFHTLVELRVMNAELFRGFYDSVESGKSTNPGYWNQLVQVGNTALAQSPRLAHLRTGTEMYHGKMLTYSASPVSGEFMQGKWPALKKKLQEATGKTGKSSLAKFLKVDLTRVSQWLTDADSQREPGAEYALQMQDWLRRQQT